MTASAPDTVLFQGREAGKNKVLVKKVRGSMVPGMVNVTFEAPQYVEAKFDSLLGMRKFWMNRGERVMLKIAKSHLLEEGDYVNFSWVARKDFGKLIRDQRVHWDWDYGR